MRLAAAVARTSRLTKVILGLMLTTTAVLASTPIADGIWNGVEQNPEPGWAVRIVVGAGDCTGTMITSQWVLTAAHCWEVTGPNPSVTSVTVAGRSATVDAVAQYPNWNGGYPDIALIHLASPLSGASTLPLATPDDMSYFAGKTVTVFGYGRLASGWNPTLIQKSPDGAWALSALCPSGYGGSYWCYKYLGPNQTGLITGGDSGGPWVGWRNGGWHILGVVSGYLGTGEWQEGTSPATGPVSSWIALMLSQPNALIASRVDINHDGAVNLPDLSTLLTQYSLRGANLTADINRDGIVSLVDLSALLANYGKAL
jgi:Trypsin